MITDNLDQAAQLLTRACLDRRRMTMLPRVIQPSNLEQGYQIQDIVATREPVAGWKVAATSQAGQNHIGISHPIAGRFGTSCILDSTGTADMTGNLMQVAEAEFVFKFCANLPARDNLYSIDEIMACVGTLHLGIELPDSRYELFVQAGAPQLIADNACANLFVLGPKIESEWRGDDLTRRKISLCLDGVLATEGVGSDALGDPKTALSWLVNHVSERGIDLLAGQFVTTGVCGDPTSVGAASHVQVEVESYGSVEINLLNLEQGSPH